jgi:hypothetical protein
MKNSITALALMATTLATPAFATNIPKLNHVFVIMMENHGYGEIIGNPNAPFINQYATQANLATNYFAVAHPSLTNYLEVTGGSNFGVLDDNNPDWHSTSCTPNIASGIPNNEASSNRICPIAGTGTDAATPATENYNENPPNTTINIDGTASFAAAATAGQTIADQLVANGMHWKSYQENLPLTGANNVDNADGVYSNLTNFGAITPAGVVKPSGVVALYAAKHDPFVYFKSVQEGTGAIGMSNVVGFEQLYSDLASGNVPDYSLIAPNQCHDQHGKNGEDQTCAFDPNDNGTQAGLNPGLIAAGDVALQKVVTAIHNSPVWKKGHSAIVVVWDENDYAIAPVTNQVVTIVDTNYGKSAKTSKNFYTHFSLLKSIEAGLGLPCLNHACDSNVKMMSDLFSAK